jgi:hypothetical protein
VGQCRVISPRSEGRWSRLLYYIVPRNDGAGIGDFGTWCSYHRGFPGRGIVSPAHCVTIATSFTSEDLPLYIYLYATGGAAAATMIFFSVGMPPLLLCIYILGWRRRRRIIIFAAPYILLISTAGADADSDYLNRGIRGVMGGYMAAGAGG